MVPVLLDANGLYARSFFMATSKPVTDQALAVSELFFRSLLLILGAQKGRLPRPATHLLACWDGGAKRDKQRAPKPQGYDELAKWMSEATAVVCGPGTSYQAPCEADDAVATAAWQLLRQDPAVVPEIYVVSGDKDLQQLVNDRVRYYCLNEKSLLPYHQVVGRWHVKHPAQISIALAILGDAADCIAGVKGWGPKKVAKIFEAVSADSPLADVAELVLSQLPADRQSVFLESLALTALQTDVDGVPAPAKIELASTRVLEDLGLASLASDLEMAQALSA